MKKKHRKQIAKLVSDAIMAGNVTSATIENHVTSWVDSDGWVNVEYIGSRTITIEMDYMK